MWMPKTQQIGTIAPGLSLYLVGTMQFPCWMTKLSDERGMRMQIVPTNEKHFFPHLFLVLLELLIAFVPGCLTFWLRPLETNWFEAVALFSGHGLLLSFVKFLLLRALLLWGMNERSKQRWVRINTLDWYGDETYLIHPCPKRKLLWNITVAVLIFVFL